MKDLKYFNEGKVLARAIRDKKISIMLKANENQKHLDNLLLIEGELRATINSELSTNGKKVFSNENLRQSELHKRLGTDEKHTKLKAIVKANNMEIDELHIGLEFSRNMLSLTVALLR